MDVFELFSSIVVFMWGRMGRNIWVSFSNPQRDEKESNFGAEMLNVHVLNGTTQKTGLLGKQQILKRKSWRSKK